MKLTTLTAITAMIAIGIATMITAEAGNAIKTPEEKARENLFYFRCKLDDPMDSNDKSTVIKGKLSQDLKIGKITVLKKGAPVEAHFWRQEAKEEKKAYTWIFPESLDPNGTPDELIGSISDLKFMPYESDAKIPAGSEILVYPINDQYSMFYQPVKKRKEAEYYNLEINEKLAKETGRVKSLAIGLAPGEVPAGSILYTRCKLLEPTSSFNGGQIPVKAVVLDDLKLGKTIFLKSGEQVTLTDRNNRQVGPYSIWTLPERKDTNGNPITMNAGAVSPCGKKLHDGLYKEGFVFELNIGRCEEKESNFYCDKMQAEVTKLLNGIKSK